MTSLRAKLALGLATAAMVATPMTPALARPWGWGAPRYGYPYRYGRYPYYRRDNTGAVIGALLGVGIIAAVAASASKANRDRDYRDSRDDRGDDFRDRDDPRDRDNNAYNDDTFRNDRGYDARGTGTRYESGTAAASDEDAAVDACAMAARDEGSRNGYFAEVRDITDTQRTGDGSYTVLGTLDQRQSYRAGNGLPRAFSCSWSNGQTSVRLS